jgi:hypothetical protein
LGIKNFKIFIHELTTISKKKKLFSQNLLDYIIWSNELQIVFMGIISGPGVLSHGVAGYG